MELVNSTFCTTILWSLYRKFNHNVA